MDRGHWTDAAVYFAAALEERPQLGGLVRPYGTWYEPYVPYYYLGLAQHHLGRDAEALASWERSEAAGVILYPRNRRKWRELVRLREESGKRLVARRTAIRAEAEGAAQELVELEDDVTGTEGAVRFRALETLLDQARAELDSRESLDVQALARASRLAREAGIVIDEVRARHEIEAARRSSQAARQEERRRQAAWEERVDRAAEAIRAGDCAAEAVGDLRDLLEESEVREAFPGMGRIQLLLAEGAAACGDVPMASLYLALARASERASEAADLAGQLERAQVEADLLEAYGDAAGLLATGGCQPRAIRALRRVTGHWWSRLPSLGRTEWSPYTLLAQAYLRCGYRGLAAEEIAVAALHAEPEGRVAAVEEQIEAAGAGDSESERAEMDRLLEADVRSPPSAGEGSVRTEDGERTEEGWAWAGVLRAAAQVDLGECDEESFALLNRREPPLHDRIGEADRLVLRARAARVCGYWETLRRLLGELDASGDSAVEELRRWHETTPTVGGRYAKSHALLIAPSYDQPGSAWPSLPGARRDLRLVAQTLRDQGFAVEVAHEAGTEELPRRIEAFMADRDKGPDDRLVLYFVGHGWTYTNPVHGLQQGFIVPAGARHPQRDQDALIDLVSMQEIGSFLQLSESRDVLVVFDSCFGGSILAATSAVPDRSASEEPVDVVIRRASRLFLTAGQAQEQVPDVSLFSRAFRAGLEGKADQEAGGDRDGVVLGRELGRYVRQRMMGLASTRPLAGRMVPQNDRGWDLASGDIAFVALPSKTVERPGALRAELDLWQVASKRGDRDSLAAFLRAYPEGRLAPAVRLLVFAEPPSAP